MPTMWTQSTCLPAQRFSFSLTLWAQFLFSWCICGAQREKKKKRRQVRAQRYFLFWARPQGHKDYGSAWLTRKRKSLSLLRLLASRSEGLDFVHRFTALALTG